jgi:hypothetical protein
METATAGGAGVVFADPPQPTITVSRHKLIPKTQTVRRRPGMIDPTPIKADFRFDSVGIKDSSVGLK